MNPPDVKFIPLKPTSQDDFNITINGTIVGTFFWKRGPKPNEKRAIVRDLQENILLCSNENEAINWIIKGMYNATN